MLGQETVRERARFLRLAIPGKRLDAQDDGLGTERSVGIAAVVPAEQVQRAIGRAGSQRRARLLENRQLLADVVCPSWSRPRDGRGATGVGTTTCGAVAIGGADGGGSGADTTVPGAPSPPPNQPPSVATTPMIATVPSAIRPPAFSESTEPPAAAALAPNPSP